MPNLTDTPPAMHGFGKIARQSSHMWPIPDSRPRIGLANLVGVTKGHLAAKRILQAITRQCDAALTVEADDVWPVWHEDLDPAVWLMIHRPADVTVDGCLIALRRRRFELVGDPTWTKISDAVYGEVLDRYMLEAPVEQRVAGAHPFTLAAVHLAPPRTPAARLEGLRAVREHSPDVFGGDLNLARSEVRPLFPRRQLRSVEVMNLLAWRRFHLGRGRRVMLPGSDHPGLIVPLGER